MEESFEGFLEAMYQSLIPDQNNPLWTEWRKNLNLMGSTMFSQFFSSRNQIERVFALILKPNENYNKNFVHGKVFEEVNKKLLEIIIDEEIFSAKTFFNDFKMASSDGFTKFAEGHSVEIKSTVSSPANSFSLQHIAQIAWNFDFFPMCIKGTIYFSQYWKRFPCFPEPLNSSIYAWVVITITDEEFSNQLDKNVYKWIFNGGNWIIERFYLTNLGVQRIMNFREHLKTRFDCVFQNLKIGYVSDMSPCPRRPEMSVLYGWKGGFLGLLKKQSFQDIFKTISMRFKEGLQKIPKESLTESKLYEYIFGNDFY